MQSHILQHKLIKHQTGSMKICCYTEHTHCEQRLFQQAGCSWIKNLKNPLHSASDWNLSFPLWDSFPGLYIRRLQLCGSLPPIESSVSEKLLLDQAPDQWITSHLFALRNSWEAFILCVWPLSSWSMNLSRSMWVDRGRQQGVWTDRVWYLVSFWRSARHNVCAPFSPWNCSHHEPEAFPSSFEELKRGKLVHTGYAPVKRKG